MGDTAQTKPCALGELFLIIAATYAAQGARVSGLLALGGLQARAPQAIRYSSGERCS